ncbi:Uncharacterised protein [Mycobacteroides abscessus subsp. abscessus]|nr:Uncharacterised protein [Mycobacteroides abscessus subsp. abscessus]
MAKSSQARCMRRPTDGIIRAPSGLNNIPTNDP